jgi:hypothetical protein
MWTERRGQSRSDCSFRRCPLERDCLDPWRANERGDRPGSTFSALKRAYGRRLKLDSNRDPHTGDFDIVRSSRSGTYDLTFLVDKGHVDSIGLNDGVLAVHCPTVSTPPPVTIGTLSLRGASGLQPVMPEDNVFATWPWFPSLTEPGGSGWDQWMPVCAGRTRGILMFGGGAFANVWFSSGAQTDAGISIGSTIDELRRAYGADLQPQTYLRKGYYHVHAPGPPPVAALGFFVRNSTVTAIGFGGRQSVDQTYGTPWC